MIGALEAALQAARARGLDTGHAGDYFESGEWLLALMELEGIGDTQYQTEFAERFREVRAAMGNPPNPFD
jgi:hypothetical protein